MMDGTRARFNNKIKQQAMSEVLYQRTRHPTASGNERKGSAARETFDGEHDGRRCEQQGFSATLDGLNRP
jgi:hypothetical protein